MKRITETNPGRCYRTPRFTFAFTLTELVVAVAVIGVLVTLHLAAATHSKAGSAQSICMSNLRALAAAWHSFIGDHHGVLPGNLDGPDAQGGELNASKSWCIGWLDFGSRSDNTNSLLLSQGQLGQYLADFRVYKCPADTSSVVIGGRAYPRVRSVSMNSYMGVRSGAYTSGFRQFKNIAEVTAPPPAQAFVFLDEREDSINDPWFAIDMLGFSPPNPAMQSMVDVPGDYHERGANLSFADGHVEAWHWRDPRTTPPHHRGEAITIGVASPNNPDVERIQAAASSREH